MFKYISKLLSKSKITEFIRYCIVGAIGTLVNLSILYFFTEVLSFYYLISAIIAFFFSVINNYVLNKVWTFKEKIQELIVRKYFKFITLSLISMTVNVSILFFLVEFFNIWYIFAEMIAILGAFLINFLGNKLWTFRKAYVTLNSQFNIEEKILDKNNL